MTDITVVNKPRTHSVEPSRLVQMGESLTLRGIDFNPHVDYRCTFGEVWVDATFVDETTLECGTLSSDMFPESDAAFSCQTVGLRDGLGFAFGPEIGTPAEYLTRPCVITDIQELIGSTAIEPHRIPVHYGVPDLLPDEERILTL